MSVESSRDEPVTLSESEKKAIRGQLERLLADPHFSHSKRFPTFLRFVTERTLAGEEDNINERWLGIEIFGRDPEYDTAADPIVRVTAAEIRKRVALYYQDSAHLGELRIALPSGSYIPRFHWPRGDSDPSLEELDRAAGKVIEIPVAHTVPPSGFRGRRSALLLAIAFVITALLSTGSLLEWQDGDSCRVRHFLRPMGLI